MTKTILVNYTGRTAGGAAYAYNMTRALAENGNRVYAVVSRQADNFAAYAALPLAGLIAIDTYTSKLEFIYRTLLFILFRRHAIKRALRGVELDAIYIPMGTYWSYFITRLFPGVPSYYTIHDPRPHSGESLFNRLLTRISRREILAASRVITLSGSFVELISGLYAIDRSRIVVIPHAAFWEYRELFAGNPRRITSYDDSKVNFLFFGRIERYKGIGVLLEAYARLERERPGRVSLTIAGKGDLTEYAQTIAGLENVTVLNYLIDEADIGALFTGRNVVTVLPYLDATQSGVIPTAQMFGSLVVASDTGALAEQLDGGRLGLLVPPGDAAALYERLESIASAPDTYAHYIEQGTEYVNGLRWDRLAAQFTESIA